MPAALRFVLIFTFTLLTLNALKSNAALDEETLSLIQQANTNSSYLGLVIPNLSEINTLLQHPSFIADDLVIDYAGKRFRFGTVEGEKVVLVMTGSGMINAATTTQLLLSLFNVKGVIHYGVSGNINPFLNIGDVAVPKKWSHTSLWAWQRFGDGPEDELPFESDGDYTREIGYLRFANYTADLTGNCDSTDNFLNNVWYQSEEVYPVDSTPEKGELAFWVSTDSSYHKIAEKKLKKVKLDACINATTCLEKAPKIQSLRFGISGNIFLDNAAYRDFLFQKFKAGPVDMESAAVALISMQQRVPYIVFRGLSNLAGGGVAESNEASIFAGLASTNVVKVVVAFIKALPKEPAGLFSII